MAMGLDTIELRRMYDMLTPQQSLMVNSILEKKQLSETDITVLIRHLKFENRQGEIDEELCGKIHKALGSCNLDFI